MRLTLLLFDLKKIHLKELRKTYRVLETAIGRALNFEKVRYR